MKKKLFVFVVLSMVVLFSACKPAVKGVIRAIAKYRLS